MVGLCGWAEEFGEDRFQGVRPDLVALHAEMEAIHRHAVEEFSIGVRQLVVHIEEADGLAVGQS
mgnify:CR=1 FL=1